MQIIYHTLGAGSADVVTAPSPVRGDAAAHTVGQIFERVAILEHRLGEGIDKCAIYESINALGIGADAGEGLLADGDEVLLLACQRTLNLKEVNLGYVGIIYVADVPLHLHLRLDASQRTDGQTVRSMDHIQVYRFGSCIRDEILAYGLRLIVVGYKAELAVGLSSIERDDAAVRRGLHLLGDGTVVSIKILVAQLANLLWHHSPRHQNLAHAVIADVGNGDEWRCHRLCLWQRDRVGVFEALFVEPYIFTAGSVAMHFPTERYLLASQLLGHHPDGRHTERVLVVVADDFVGDRVIGVKPCHILGVA